MIEFVSRQLKDLATSKRDSVFYNRLKDLRSKLEEQKMILIERLESLENKERFALYFSYVTTALLILSAILSQDEARLWVRVGAFSVLTFAGIAAGLIMDYMVHNHIPSQIKKIEELEKEIDELEGK